MMQLQVLEEKSKIGKFEIENIWAIIFNSFIVPDYFNEVHLSGKDEFLEDVVILLNKYLQNYDLNSVQDKLSLINFIDKLNMQRELLALQKGQVTAHEINKAGSHLGKKAQSAFEDK